MLSRMTSGTLRLNRVAGLRGTDYQTQTLPTPNLELFQVALIYSIKNTYASDCAVTLESLAIGSSVRFCGEVT